MNNLNYTNYNNEKARDSQSRVYTITLLKKN